MNRSIMSVFDSYKSHAIVNERLYVYIAAPTYVDTWLFLTESNLVERLQIERSRTMLAHP